MNNKFTTIQLDKEVVIELVKLKYQTNKNVKSYNQIIYNLITEYKKINKLN